MAFLGTDILDQGDPEIAMASIQRHLMAKLERFNHIETKTDYMRALQTVDDSFNEYFYILKTHELASHALLWLNVLLCLTNLSTSLWQHHKKYNTGSEPSAENVPLSYSGSLHALRALSGICLQNLNLDSVLASRHLEEAFLHFVPSVLESLNIDPSATRQSRLLEHLVASFNKYTQLSTNNFQEELESVQCKVLCFPILTQIAKTAFILGMCDAIIPIVASDGGDCIVTDSLAALVIPDKDVSLDLIVDYHRYFAFCLYTINAEKETYNESFALLADRFFRVLLSLPNLSLTNYYKPRSSVEQLIPSHSGGYILLEEREEISFFYLLNHLSKMRDLREFLDSDKHYKQEWQFFLHSFNKRTALELETSASASLSRAGSMVSMTRIRDVALQQLDRSHQYKLSSILYEGTYKEKHRLVVEFFGALSENTSPGNLNRFLRSFDLGQLHSTGTVNPSSDILLVINRMNKALYPGKLLYVKAMDQIVRLFHLLIFKFMIVIYPKSLDFASLLRSHVKTQYKLTDILKVREFVSWREGEGYKVLFKDLSSEDEQCKLQIELMELTQNIEKCVQTAYLSCD